MNIIKRLLQRFRPQNGTNEIDPGLALAQAVFESNTKDVVILEGVDAERFVQALNEGKKPVEALSVVKPNKKK